MHLDSLYLNTGALSITLEAGLLQVRYGMNCGHEKVPDNATLHPIAFISKSILNALRLENFHHYNFARKVCIISDCKPIVAILSKDGAMLFQWLQCIMLCKHQYRVCIRYMHDLD